MTEPVYDAMWGSFCAALAEDRYELDRMIASPDDCRRGIAAIAYLQESDPACSRAISRFLEDVKQIEPDQYYHPEQELHLTVLSIISCVAGFTLADINARDYVRVFQEAMRGVGPIEIVFRGVSASPGCVVIQGFPTGPGLEQLRNNLRRLFQASGLQTTMDSRYRLTTAHISAIRFRSRMGDKEQFLKLLEKYRNHLFGRVHITQFELVFNNWYQNLSVTRRLEKYSAKPVSSTT